VSVIGTVIAAIIVDVKTAVQGIDTESENLPVSSLTERELPHVRVLGSSFEAEPLEDFLQETHRWTVDLLLVQKGGTRESLETKIEAIRDEIFSDQTLGGAVERAHMESAVPHSQTDAEKLIGVITVIAEKVKS